MSALAWVFDAPILGCLLAWRWIGLRGVAPGWARRLLLLGMGTAGGIGLASCLYFLVGVLAGSPVAAMAAELGLLGYAVWGAASAWRQGGPEGGDGPLGGAPSMWIVLAALIALVISSAAIAAGWDSNPQGNWDAWAIWNLRARFLASPGLAPRAWSPLLGSITHPEYPLLVPAFTARCWAFSHSLSTAAPAAASYLFFLGLVAITAGAVAVLAAPSLGALAALALAATPALVHEVSAQYADVPLACYFAGAAAFALLDQPVAAGILAGFAAWTKDEGLLFLVLFFAAAACLRPKLLWALLCAAAPVTLLVAFYKAVLARGTPSLLGASVPGAGHRLADVSRYGTILAAFAREFIGSAWYYPIAAVVIAAAVLRFDRERLRRSAFAGAIALALPLGYGGIYAITANDLTWQLQTSLGRLLIQIWPLALLAVLAAVRAPQIATSSQAAAATVPPLKSIDAHERLTGKSRRRKGL